MQGHNQQKKPHFVTQSRFHQGKAYGPFYHQTPPGGDVGGFSGGPGGAPGASLRLNQYSTATHPPPAAAPQPPQGPPQLRAQTQPPPHNPHNTAAAPPVPQSQHHTHTHVTLSQHSQHHPVLQTGGVGGHGTGTGVGQVGGVPPGPSPAPPGPPHEINTQTLPPVSTQQIQQGSGGSLPAHSMMYPNTTQTQPQGPQPNAQGQFYPHPGGPNAPPHLHNPGQPRQVALAAPSQHMANFPVPMPPNMMQFYPSGHGPSNVLYSISPNGIRHMLNGVPAGRRGWLSNRMTHPIDLEFQPMGPPRQTTPHTPPGQFHPSPMPQPHPQGPYPPLQYPAQGGKHEAAPMAAMQFRQPQPVFYPPSTQHQPMKAPVPLSVQRERKTLAIVDPNTGKNILDDMNNDKSDKTPTPPQSAESSASNTPAPIGTPPNKAEQVDIAAQFAAEVAKKAAEKDIMETETIESVVRTNKQSESSPSNIIHSDSRENKDKLKNSIANKVEHVNSETVDSVGKTVPEPVEVIKPQSKPDSTQIPFPQLSQPMPTTMILPQMPQQVAVQQLSQKVPPQPLQPQQIPQQLPQQPPLPVSPQPPVQVSPQPPVQVSPQQSTLQGPQQPQQQVPQQPKQQQQPPNQVAQQAQQKQKSPSPQQNSKVMQNAQPTQQQPTEPAVPPQKQQQRLPSPQPQATQQNVSVNDAEQKIENVSQNMTAVQIEVPAKSEPMLPVKQSSPKPAILPNNAPKEKEATPEIQPPQSKRRGGPREENTTPARENVEENAVQTQKATTPPAVQPPPQQQPPPPTPPPQQPPPPQQQQQQPQPQQQPPQPQQQPQQEQQQTPPPPSNKLGTQPVQNAKEKEKTPEVVVPQSTPTPPPPQKPASLPPSKEATPQPTTSPTPSEEPKSERSSKEREVNNIEVEVNNIHDAEKKDDKPQLKYAYKDDQWSPINPEGKRQYDRRFLLELQNNPLSLKKPESLPNLEVVRDGPGRHKPYDSRGAVPHIGVGPDFTPDYVKPVMGSKQPRLVGRNNSQQRRDPGGGQVSRGDRGGRGGQGKVIVIPLSAGREPKLKTTENAWKPSVMESESLTDEQAATEEVVKRMRGILNKLTPEKFGKLVETVQQMPIDTTERLSAVIDLIFEKAVDEQGFSSTYASLCQVLSKMSVRGEGSDDSKSEVKFRNLIINKCQKEFEKDNMEEIKPKRMKEIEVCTDPEKKLELKAKWDFDETKLRQRSVGNIRFIGELYKLRMLTSPIMMRIIGTLLQKKDEESLECLCKLLTTIGKILETQCAQQTKPMEELDKHFHSMQKIIGERQTNSRVRFLVMDVIDLRKNRWIPRREDNKPKTKAQVHEEVKREELELQINLAATMNRRDDRDRDRDRDRKRSRDNRGPQMSDNEGWNTVATKNRASFDSSRLKNTFSRPGAGENKEVILRGTGFSNWARGSSGGGLKDHDDKQQENRFTVLADSMGGNPTSADNRRATPSVGRLAPGGGGPPRQAGFASKSMPPPTNDKERVISAVKMFVGSDRSKSTSRPESRENSIPRENNAMKGPAKIDEDAAAKFAVAIIEEYAHTADSDEAKLLIKERFSSSTVKYFIQYSLEWVLDRDAIKRKRVGQLYHDIILENLISIDQFLEGVQGNLAMTEDYAIDIPQVCDYFGEIFAPCLNDNAISIKRLLEMATFANSKSATVFACIIAKAANIITSDKVADLWNSSGLSWSNIIPDSANVDEFLAKQHVEFTVDRSKSVDRVKSSSNSGWDPQKLEAEFLALFKRASNAEIFEWIDANFANDAKSSKFIRALVTALVESQAMTSNDGSSIRATEDFEDKMKNRLTVLRKYVDSSDKLELQCIYALQALSVKHQHPPGLLEKCFNAFYDSDVVSEEAFDEWLNNHDPDEQEGKGVCVATVKNFMRWLKEAEIEESENQA